MKFKCGSPDGEQSGVFPEIKRAKEISAFPTERTRRELLEMLFTGAYVLPKSNKRLGIASLYTEDKPSFKHALKDMSASDFNEFYKVEDLKAERLSRAKHYRALASRVASEEGLGGAIVHLQVVVAREFKLSNKKLEQFIELSDDLMNKYGDTIEAELLRQAELDEGGLK